jgi:hypothetical protein
MIEEKDETSGAAAAWGLLLCLPSMYIYGRVCEGVWRWFIQPAYPNVPPLTMGAAMGISLLFALYRTSRSTHTKPEDVISHALFEPLIIAGVAWAAWRIWLA